MIQRLPLVIRVLILGSLLLIALGLCMVSGYFLLSKPLNPALNPLESLALRVQLSTRDSDLHIVGGSDPTPVCFAVKQGDTASVVGQRLVGQGFIKDANLFRNYARYFGLDAQLQAGVFSLNKTMTLPQLAQALTNTGANSTIFRVVEGKRIEEIMQLINTANPPLAFTGDDFFALVGAGAANRSAAMQSFAARMGIPVNNSFEGFLFPDTYTLPACAKADELVSRMLQNFDQKFTQVLRDNVQAQGLSPFQAVTLASIVEREAVVNEERPIIASVYLNRLRKPMTLDADPTVQYALGNGRDPSTWWPNITIADYKSVNSPYNTYLNQGLPPGPIDSPGLASLMGVANPQTTQFIYFRATCTGDGRHNFAVTLAEQQKNAC